MYDLRHGGSVPNSVHLACRFEVDGYFDEFIDVVLFIKWCNIMIHVIDCFMLVKLNYVISL